MASGFREGKRRAVQLNIRLHGQAVKTPPFHGGNRGSIPLGVTKLELSEHHYYSVVDSDSFFIAAERIGLPYKS